MKRNLACLISIIALFSCLYSIRVETEKEGIIKGNKIADNIYVYQLNEEEKEWNGYYLKDNEIYYLTKTGNTYELNKRNIYSGSIWGKN